MDIWGFGAALGICQGIRLGEAPALMMTSEKVATFVCKSTVDNDIFIRRCLKENQRVKLVREYLQDRISHLTALTSVRGPGPKGGGGGGPLGPVLRSKITFFPSISVNFGRALRAFIIFQTKIFALSY